MITPTDILNKLWYHIYIHIDFTDKFEIGGKYHALETLHNLIVSIEEQ